MKFLCVPCDQPMKLRTTASPESGTLSVVYTCPACDYEIAMLTNPLETQLVQSLGVKIGPQGSGCPFSGMIAESSSSMKEGGELTWTPGARARLQNIPEFVRPMATAGIEKLAREQGRTEIDEAVLDEARAFFGM
ncbi:MAG TPA: PCP reductase family protein [Candidatus Polarisedimenticolaceae bacterium]|nr:PCP reductase family protein [Candidatus Polarisedimenticolaceae bacterium]